MSNFRHPTVQRGRRKTISNKYWKGREKAKKKHLQPRSHAKDPREGPHLTQKKTSPNGFPTQNPGKNTDKSVPQKDFTRRVPHNQPGEERSQNCTAKRLRPTGPPRKTRGRTRAKLDQTPIQKRGQNLREIRTRRRSSSLANWQKVRYQC